MPSQIMNWLAFQEKIEMLYAKELRNKKMKIIFYWKSLKLFQEITISWAPPIGANVIIAMPIKIEIWK